MFQHSYYVVKKCSIVCEIGKQRSVGGGEVGIRQGKYPGSIHKWCQFLSAMLSVVVVKYTLASGIFGWTNPIVLQRWNISANHTGEIYKKYTMPTRHIELYFQVSFDSTCTHIITFTLKIFWYFFQQIQTTWLCSHVHDHCCLLSKISTTIDWNMWRGWN